MAGKRTAVTILVFAVAIGYLALALSSSGSTHAQSFNPTATFAVANSAGGVASDTTITTNFPAPDYNFGGDIVYTYYPPTWKIAADSEIPNGAGSGTVNAAINIAVGNGACNTPLNPVFLMWDSDTDINDVLNAAAMSWVLKNAIANPVPDVRGEKSTDPANGLYDFIDGYPQFLNEMFDPDGTGAQLPLQPRSRMAGVTTVSGENILLQFLTFNPGQLSSMPGITAQMGANMGYPSVAVLNNPRDANPAPSSIADFCTPLATLITSKGTTTDNPATGAVNEAGYVKNTNPPANTGILNTGTHIERAYAQAYRDWDGDGIETYMDTCPNSNSAAWNPRLPGGPGNSDNDSDGIPNDCDPTPNADTGIGDHDFDSYSNRNDNCPTVANGTTPPQDNQFETEAWANVPAADLGPKGDQMGDACDANDTLEQGSYAHASMWAPICIGGADPDGDGWCTDTETALGSDTGNGAKTPESEIVDLYITGVAGVLGVSGAQPTTTLGTCTDGIDNDGDGNTDAADTGCQSPGDADKDGYDEVTPPLDNCGKAGTTLIKNPDQTDTDGDGIGDACDADKDNDPSLARTDAIEWKLGTDPLDGCPNNPTGSAGTMKHDAWPLDMDQSKDISVTGDVFKFRGNVGKSVATNWNVRRLDLDASGDISVTGDVFLYRGRIGNTCT